MSRRETTASVCDLDGADGATLRFALDGVAYEIELCPPHERQMYQELRPFIDRARPHGAKRAARPATGRHYRPVAKRQETAAMRAWAREHGYVIAGRGRMPAGIAAAYRAANGGQS